MSRKRHNDEYKKDLYCALLTCSTLIEDLKHNRHPEFLTPCYFCKYCKYTGNKEGDCDFQFYERLSKMAADLGINISPMLQGDNSVYAVHLDENKMPILEQFKPTSQEVIPWKLHTT